MNSTCLITERIICMTLSQCSNEITYILNKMQIFVGNPLSDSDKHLGVKKCDYLLFSLKYIEINVKKRSLIASLPDLEAFSSRIARTNRISIPFTM